MRALPSSAVPTLPSAVAAAARTSGSGSWRAATRSRETLEPPRMPIANAASTRTFFFSSRSAPARPRYAAGSTAVYGAIDVRSYSSEKVSRKRSMGPPRSRSP